LKTKSCRFVKPESTVSVSAAAPTAFASYVSLQHKDASASNEY